MYQVGPYCNSESIAMFGLTVGLKSSKLEIITLLDCINCVLHQGLSGLCCACPNLCKVLHAAMRVWPCVSTPVASLHVQCQAPHAPADI